MSRIKEVIVISMPKDPIEYWEMIMKKKISMKEIWENFELRKKYRERMKGKKYALGKHYKRSEENKQKLKKSWKDIERKRKLSKRMRNNKYAFGNHFKLTKEQKEKQLLAISGQNAPNWLGGISFEPYGLEFNNKLKEQIRARNNFRCQECFRHQDELFDKSGKKYRLIVHHIDFNKQNNSPNNLISLCRNCHSQTNYSRDEWIEYFHNKIISTTTDK